MNKKIVVILLVGLITVGGIAFTKQNKREIDSQNTIYKMYLIDTDGKIIPYNGNDFPKDGYMLNKEKSTCTNGAELTQNEDKTISVSVSMNTRCTVYFNKDKSDSNQGTSGGATNYIENLANGADTSSTDAIGDTGLAYDGETNSNLRYIGANPNNYVTFNGEKAGWRIVGVFNSIDDGTGKKETRIKLVRANSIGNYSWDTSDSSINSGYGVNEWSQADIMKLLNPGYESESVDGSLYWNKSSGSCYTGSSNTSSSCDFTATGLTKAGQDMIDNAVWNLGTINASDSNEGGFSNWTANLIYSRERGDLIGKQCSSGTTCNDTVTRTISWTGKVALIYPSDYIYATSGGSVTDRNTCLTISAGNPVLRLFSKHWGSSNASDCHTNDWLRSVDNNTWALNPYGFNSRSANSFDITKDGYILYHFDDIAQEIKPAVYLKSSVNITGGTGTVDDPYTLG